MKQFSCGDVVPGCGATFRGASEEEILAQVGRHACADHGIGEISAELVDTVRRHIQAAPEHA